MWPLSRQCEIPWHFPAGLWHSSVALGMLSVTHIMPILVLNTWMDVNMQFMINSFRQLIPDKIFSLTFPWFLVKSLTFPWQVSNSLTFSGFPDKWSPWMLQFYAELAMIILLKFLNDSLLRVVSTGWQTASIKYYFGAAVIWLCKFLHIWLCQLNWWLY